MARRKNQDGLKSKLLLEQDGGCFYCHKPLTYMRAVADHKTPLSRGGSNHKSNFVASCPECDAKKGRKTVEEFTRMRGGKN